MTDDEISELEARLEQIEDELGLDPADALEDDDSDEALDILDEHKGAWFHFGLGDSDQYIPVSVAEITDDDYHDADVTVDYDVCVWATADDQVEVEHGGRDLHTARLEGTVGPYTVRDAINNGGR